MSNRREFVKASLATTAVLSLPLHKAFAANPANHRQSCVIRDRRFAVSKDFAAKASGEGLRVLDIDADVSNAYRALVNLVRSNDVISVTGVTTHTARDLLRMAVADPYFKLTFDTYVEAPDDDPGLELAAWQVKLR